MDSRQNQSSQLPQPLDATKTAMVHLTRLHQQRSIGPSRSVKTTDVEVPFLRREKHGSFKRPLATS
jgi:hypothetical protein